jgi:hypothetical protein
VRSGVGGESLIFRGGLTLEFAHFAVFKMQGTGKLDASNQDFAATFYDLCLNNFAPNRLDRLGSSHLKLNWSI